MKNIVLSVLLASLLAACSSSQVKEAPKVTETPPAPKTQTMPNNPPPVPVVTKIEEKKMEVNPLTDPNNILSKRNVYFDYDKFNVKPQYESLVEAHAKYLAAHSDASIRIEGNADERGSREYNLALAQKRAVAVKKEMNLLGVADKQIETISYGKEKPKALGHDEADWAENRRDDIVYSGE